VVQDRGKVEGGGKQSSGLTASYDRFARIKEEGVTPTYAIIESDEEKAENFDRGRGCLQ